MATSSLLGGSRLPESVGGKDIDALGPSDNSDSGSDAMGAYGEDSDSDAAGTGNRASVEGPGHEHTDGDILPDHLEAVDGAAMKEGADRFDRALEEHQPEQDPFDSDTIGNLAADEDEPEEENGGASS